VDLEVVAYPAGLADGLFREVPAADLGPVPRPGTAEKPLKDEA
jgi:hypothetical protein